MSSYEVGIMSKKLEAEPVAAEVKVKKEKSKKRKMETEEGPEKARKEKSKRRKTEEVERTEPEPVSEKKTRKEKKIKSEEDSEVVPQKKIKKEKKSKSNSEDEIVEAEPEPKPKKEKSKKRKDDKLVAGADSIKLDEAPEDAAPKTKKAKKTKSADSEEKKDEEMIDALAQPKAAKKNKSGALKKKEKKAKAALQAEGGVTSVEAVEARVAADTAAKEEDGEGIAKASKKGARFIVFVGNLPYTATQELLQAHFKKIEPVSIRLLTDKETGKSKGTAFVELKDWDRMNTALKLYHHSQFDDGSGKKARRINVELS